MKSTVMEVVGEKVEIAARTPPRAKIGKKSGRTVYTGALPDEWDSGAAVLARRALLHGSGRLSLIVRS